MTVSPDAQVDQPRTWFDKTVEDVVAELATNADSGLSAAEAHSRLADLARPERDRRGALTVGVGGGPGPPRTR